VGGLDALKSWLTSRSMAYTPAARAYGLPSPRGALVAGVSGTGKSLTCKAIATAWQVPLLRLDLNSLKSKFVGESEGNLRKALRVIEALGRCVVWLDEVEKALSGATQGAADGGVSADALGAILSWMQERSGEAFIIATANDVSALPPEFLRRFDDVWFVDLPNHEERMQIITAAIKAHGRTPGNDLWAYDVASATDGFTGAEIAGLVPDAMYSAFADGGREPDIKDVLNATKNVVPLSKTAAEKIAALRSWAAGRARPATTPEAGNTERAVIGRALDI
jgi:SpoVK/Ycf46/Vps4 family AAA+-type ATPase